MNNKYINGSINILLMIILFIINIFGIIKLDLYKTNIIIIISIIFIIVLSVSIHSYLSKNKNSYNAVQFIAFLFNIVFLFNIYNIENTYNYYSNIFTDKYIYVDYNMYVKKKNTTYSNINKLKDKNVSIISESNSIENYLNNKNININKCNNIEELEESINNGKSQAILLSEDEYKNLSNSTKDKIKVINKTKIKIEKNK